MLTSKGAMIYSEITEQPDTWQQAIKTYNKERETLIWFKKMKFNQVVFIGGGVSYYASVFAGYLFKSTTRIQAYSFQSSDIYVSDTLPFDARLKTLVVALSRSGNTDETVWAVEYIKSKIPDIQILSLVCQPDSALQSISDKTIVIESAADSGPIPIRTFSTMIYLLELIAGALGGKSDLLGELSRTPKIIDLKAYHDVIIKMRRLQEFKKVIFVGTGPNLALAAYGSLVMKSMSSTMSTYYNTFELRHNNFIGAGPDTLVVFILSDRLMEQELAAMRDIAKMRAQLLLIHEDLDEKVEGSVENAIKLQSGLTLYARTILTIPYLQMLAFQHALSNGINPDKSLHTTDIVSFKTKPDFMENEVDENVNVILNSEENNQ
jgi:glutamine---fructose-6-phosphate transaminase (isomerizing)